METSAGPTTTQEHRQGYHPVTYRELHSYLSRKSRTRHGGATLQPRVASSAVLESQRGLLLKSSWSRAAASRTGVMQIKGWVILRERSGAPELAAGGTAGDWGLPWA